MGERVVTMTSAELLIAGIISMMRRTSAMKNGRNGRYGMSTHSESAWTIDVFGCIAEMGVAKALNLYWSGDVGIVGNPDVGGLIDVRSIDAPRKRLMLHDEDKDDRPYVLAYVAPPEVILKGWLFSREGKRRELWGDPGNHGRQAYFVPNRELHDISDLEKWLIVNLFQKGGSDDRSRQEVRRQASDTRQSTALYRPDGT